MRRASLISAVLAAAVFPACGRGLTYVKVGDVALGRVVVYRNGVAYYERRAQVRGGTLAVSVPRERVDDFLKSLTVVDARTGKPLPVSFPRTQSEGGPYIEMTLQVPGAKDYVADVVMTYVTESTAWKPSYRLVVGDDGKMMLEGWAIVDNLSGEDWKDVMVGVGSSSAMSFRYDLWSVRTVEREALSSQEQFAVAPPTAVSPYGGSAPQVGVELANLNADEIRPPSGHPDRTFEGSLGAAPGAQGDAYGTGFSGSSSGENTYVVDGVGTTGLDYTDARNNTHVAAPSATTGVIRGRITDKDQGMGLPGVTVVATSPALQGEQVEITDEAGVYQLANLPPGAYTVTFYYNDTTTQRGNVAVGAGKTVPVFQKVDTSARGGETIEVAGREPTIDPASTTQGTVITGEYLNNIPVRGRSSGDKAEHHATRPEPPKPDPIKTGDDKLAKLVPELTRKRQAIVVQGYADGGDGDPAARSLDRANIVRNQLIDAGMPPALVRAEGEGYHPGHAAGAWLVTADPAAERAAPGTPRTAAVDGPDTPVGESHFQSQTAMTVGKGTSAMVSMLRARTTGEEVYLYDAESARGNTRFAFKSVRLINPTDSTLEAGPMTVYGDGRYIGEGLTEPIPPRAPVVVPFALDRQIVIDRDDDTTDELSRLETLQRGVLTAEVQHVKRTKLTITSRLAKSTRVYVRHTVEKGWDLLDNELPSERVGDARLFEVDVAAGQSRTIEIAEATPLTRTLDLGAESTLAMMKVYVESPHPTPELKRQLTALLAVHRDLVDTSEKIRTMREHMVEYRERAAELDEQLHSLKNVKSAAALSHDLADKARQMSDRVQATTLAIVDAQEHLMLARVQFQDSLAELSLPDAMPALAARP